jgi:hypothetical protein
VVSNLPDVAPLIERLSKLQDATAWRSWQEQADAMKDAAAALAAYAQAYAGLRKELENVAADDLEEANRFLTRAIRAEADLAAARTECEAFRTTLATKLGELMVAKARIARLSVLLAAMCGWYETLAEKLGWDRENAGAGWASHDAARAELERP